MLTEKQAKLCMTFWEGKLVETKPPAWFVKHLSQADDNPDWNGSLRDLGLQSSDRVEATETFEIYKTPDGGYFIDYTDVFESAAWIFISSPAEYVTFRATILAPLAMLAMRSDQFESWQQERREKLERS